MTDRYVCGCVPPLYCPPHALNVEAMAETLRYLYHADQPCDAPNKHRHDHIALGIVGQYPRFARRVTLDARATPIRRGGGE